MGNFLSRMFDRNGNPTGKGKGKLAPQEFVDILIARSDEIFRSMYRLFSHDLEFKGDEKTLALEARILSLWITTLSTPSKTYREMLHAASAQRMGLTTEQADMFLAETDIRYRTYFEAYDMWMESHRHTDHIGPAIIDTIMNGNVGRTIGKNGLPLVGMNESFQVQFAFSAAFEATLKMVEKIKNERGIEELP
jgi:hypothetical protein